MRISTRHALGPLAGLAALALLAAPAAAQEEKAPAPGMDGQHRMHRMHEQGGQGMGMGGGMLGGMSDAEKEALKAGRGLGAGRLAMMHGYPGPKHILEAGEELGLTSAQKETIGTIFAEAKASFAEMGAELVEKEEALEAMFASGDVDVDELEKRAAEIGELKGRLRAGHLAAHVRTKEALTAEQLETLSSMAGAHGGQESGAPHRHGRDPSAPPPPQT